ncbi:MAG: hypothetical protein ABIH03_13975, partial [Pseudomonadota bacterium]
RSVAVRAGRCPGISAVAAGGRNRAASGEQVARQRQHGRLAQPFEQGSSGYRLFGGCFQDPVFHCLSLVVASAAGYDNDRLRPLVYLEPPARREVTKVTGQAKLCRAGDWVYNWTWTAEFGRALATIMEFEIVSLPAKEADFHNLIANEICAVLKPYLGPAVAKTIFIRACRLVKTSPETLQADDMDKLLKQLAQALEPFGGDATAILHELRLLRKLII